MSNIEKNLKKILRGKKGCSPQKYLPSTKKVGSGEYGNVFKGNVNGDGKRYVAYKEVKLPGNNITLTELQNYIKQNPARMEYTIAKKLKGFGVPENYIYKTCSDKVIIYMEYIDGVELRKWWKTNPTLEQQKSLIVQIIYNLYRIHRKYPKFRHHDLHGGNILIKKVPEKNIKVELNNKTYTISNGGIEAVMIDFGFSLLPRIKNPLINDNYFKNIVISRNSHKLYDIHFFLNSLYEMTTQTKNPGVRNFINSLLPHMYLGAKSTVIKDYRLIGTDRKNVAHTFYLPGFEKILSRPFLTGETRALPLPKPRKFAKPPIAPKKKASTPINKEAAFARAVAVMKKQREVAPPKLIPRRRRWLKYDLECARSALINLRKYLKLWGLGELHPHP